MNKLLLNIKNLFPYLFLITIYFCFINIEARNDLSNQKKNNQIRLNEKQLNVQNSIKSDTSTRIPIPIIPYNQ